MIKFDLSKVEFSRNDLRLGIKVPKYLTEELAYFMGFHVEDGCMTINKRDHAIDYCLQYEGHKINEDKFYKEILGPLIKKIFCKEISISNNRTAICFRSKVIVSFLNCCCQITLSPKKNIVVSEIVFNSPNNIKQSFLRGLADTDFSLVFKNSGKNPVISH